MFDVPVLEVTASSTPVIINSVSRAKEITLLKPQVSASAAGLQSQASPAVPVEKNLQTTVDTPSAKVSLPQGQFQLLEPLNLADATESLVEMFVLPFGEATEPSEDDLTSPDAPPSVKASVSTAISVGEPSTIDESSVAIAELTKPSPLPSLRKGLDQCVDVPYSAAEGVITFQVIRQGTVLGEVSSRDGAEQVMRSFKAMLMPEQLDPNQITPVLGDGQPVIRLGNDVFAQVIHQGENHTTPDTGPNLSHEWTAINWSDQLRQQLGAAPLDAGNVQIMLKRLQPSEQQLNGIASWYGPYFHGRTTANGETFDQNTLTAAHKTLPFNTVLQVRNLKNSRSIVVRINDRGPYIGKRSLDLSKVAAQCLDSETIGIIPYEAIILEQPTPVED